jgi:hypothetical protein
MMPMRAACKSRTMEKVEMHYCTATTGKDLSTSVNNGFACVRCALADRSGTQGLDAEANGRAWRRRSAGERRELIVIARCAFGNSLRLQYPKARVHTALVTRSRLTLLPGMELGLCLGFGMACRRSVFANGNDQCLRKMSGFTRE